MSARPSGRPSQVSKPTVSSSLYVRVKYNNTLPDIPFDPKFLVNPLDVSRFVDYETTSLEQNAKHELLTPADLGVDIDLILPERYAVPSVALHDPEDERLLNDDESQLEKTKKSPRDKPHSQLHNKVVPWLKKTEYISTEYNRYGSSNEKTETKVGYNVRKNLKEEDVFLDKENQIKAIDATFEAARIPIHKHPSKPGVTAIKVMPVLPDFDTWKHEYVHVKFDSEPADPSEADQMSQAILKGAVDDETNENMVKYFLPTEITMADQLLDQHHGYDYNEDKEYEYKSVRDYGWSVKDSLKDDFFFSFRDDAVHYNRLTLEVSLKKKRSKAPAITTLIIKHQDWDEDEIARHEKKLSALEKPTPSAKEDFDLTAQSLEQSYESLTPGEAGSSGGGAGRIAGDDLAPEVAASPNPDGNNEASGSSSSSSSASSSSGTSTPESSSVSSSSGEESGDDKKSDDDDDDD